MKGLIERKAIALTAAFCFLIQQCLLVSNQAYATDPLQPVDQAVPVISLEDAPTQTLQDEDPPRSSLDWLHSGSLTPNSDLKTPVTEARLLWTDEDSATLVRMKNKNHPWWKLIKTNADLTGTPGERYADTGMWATYVYLATGDVTYAQKAWTHVKGDINQKPGNANYIREMFTHYAWMYDLLRPALSPQDIQIFLNGDDAGDTNRLNGLNGWSRYALADGTALWEGGFRVGDSDQTVGMYFGGILTDLVTARDNPEAGRFTNGISKGSAGDIPIGGLEATGVNYDTVRNTISVYAKMAEGGQWIESSEYNEGTLVLLMMGYEGVKRATGHDDFPEITTYLKQAAMDQIYQFTPDLKQTFQWGDEEHPRSLRLFSRMMTLGAIEGILEGEPEAPYVNQLITDLAQQYGTTGYLTAEPWERMFMFYNPTSAKKDWRTLPAGLNEPGNGFQLFHAGWDIDDSFFMAHYPSRMQIDHEIFSFGDFQLYRNGEWALTHPIGYGNSANSGESVNSMSIAGLSSMLNRGVIEQVTGDDFAYSVGNTNGNYYASNYYIPPPDFLHEWTRSTFYLSSPSGGLDTIVVYDRVNAENPKNLPNYDRYSAGDRLKIEKAPSLKQWFLHAPVAPEITGDIISWTTAGGQKVSLNLLTAGLNAIVEKEADVFKGSNDFYAYELTGYRVTLSPKVEKQWDTFLNVVQASGSNSFSLSNEVVKSVEGRAEGALLHRAGLNDTLVMFGADQNKRTHTAGFEFSVKSSTANLDLNILDLNSDQQWEAVVGGNVISMTVSKGMGRFELQGLTGNVTITIRATTQDTTPPSFSNIVVQGLKQNIYPNQFSAMVSWTTTGTTDNELVLIAPNGIQKVFSLTANGMAHSAYVQPMAPDSVYRVTVNGKDAAGNSGTSEEFVIDTRPQAGDQTAPDPIVAAPPAPAPAPVISVSGPKQPIAGKINKLSSFFNWNLTARKKGAHPGLGAPQSWAVKFKVLFGQLSFWNMPDLSQKIFVLVRLWRAGETQITAKTAPSPMVPGVKLRQA